MRDHNDELKSAIYGIVIACLVATIVVYLAAQ
jgi:hypothetical protein